MLIPNNSKLLFIGDSITDVDRARPIGEGISIALGKSYVATVDAMIKVQNPLSNIRIVNMATSGNTSDNLVNRWQTDVLDLNPDWVAVLIGINDVWRRFDCYLMSEIHISPKKYGDNLRFMMSSTLKTAKGMIMMSPYFIEKNREDEMRACMDEYRAVMESVTAEFKQTYIDLQSEFDKFLEKRHSSALAGDRVHPNHVGHMLIAKTFMDTISAG